MENDRIEKLLDDAERLRDGFVKQIADIQTADSSVVPPLGFTQSSLLETMQRTVDDLTATLKRYGRA